MPRCWIADGFSKPGNRRRAPAARRRQARPSSRSHGASEAAVGAGFRAPPRRRGGPRVHARATEGFRVCSAVRAHRTRRCRAAGSRAGPWRRLRRRGVRPRQPAAWLPAAGTAPAASGQPLSSVCQARCRPTARRARAASARAEERTSIMNLRPISDKVVALPSFGQAVRRQKQQKMANIVKCMDGARRTARRAPRAAPRARTARPSSGHSSWRRTRPRQPFWERSTAPAAVSNGPASPGGLTARPPHLGAHKHTHTHTRL